jgi:hypothetical protein
VSESWIQPRLSDARWTMQARDRLQRLSWFMHRLKEPLSLGQQGRRPRRPRDRRGQADRLAACRSGITGSTASDRRRRDTICGHDVPCAVWADGGLGLDLE